MFYYIKTVIFVESLTLNNECRTRSCCTRFHFRIQVLNLCWETETICHLLFFYNSEETKFMKYVNEDNRGENLQHVILIHSEICSNVGCHVPEFSSLHIHDLLWYLEQTNFKLYFFTEKTCTSLQRMPFAKVISLSSNGFLFSFLTNSVSKNRGMLRRELKRMTGTTYPATL